MIGTDDYLLIRAKVAQWYHMMNWSELPEVWHKLPSEVQREVFFSNLAPPGALPAMSGYSPSSGSLMATGTSPPPTLLAETSQLSQRGAPSQ